ncbi:MAG: 30S ribosomal protein S15 [bacterium]|nr:30S ribosomal protein S15 [bacterium]
MISRSNMISKEQKNKIIQKYAIKEGDTGSSQVQIALLTYEIEDLTGHLKQHKKDFSSRRGLLKKVGLRRRLMRYLKKEDKGSYETLIKALKLKDSV